MYVGDTGEYTTVCEFLDMTTNPIADETANIVCHVKLRRQCAILYIVVAIYG